MQSPSRVFQKGVPLVRPANALPLLLEAEVTAYNASDRPCGPDSCRPSRPPSKDSATAAPVSTSTGVIST